MRPSSVADLARRDPVIPGLGVVLDPDAFAAALHAANPEAAVRAARIVYVKYKPQSYCRVAYRLDVGGAEVDVAVRACRPDDLASRLEDRSWTGVWGPLGPGRIVLDHCAAIVTVFPYDVKLPQLRDLTDVAQRRELLRELFADRSDLRNGELRGLRYLPERRYVAELYAPPPGHGRALLKAYAAKDYIRAKSHALAFQSRGPLRVARLLGRSESGRLLAFEWLPGRPLIDLSIDFSVAFDGGAAIATGAALAVLHGEHAEGLPYWTREAEGAGLVARARELGFICPQLARRADALAQRLGAQLAAAPAVRHPIHGDFSAKQVLVGDEGVAIIDFDLACYGDPAEDVGNFMAGVERYALRGDLSPRRVEALRDGLLEGYALAARSRLPPRIGLYAAAGLLRRAGLPFCYREPDWERRTELLLERAEARLNPVPKRVKVTTELPQDAALPGLVAIHAAGLARVLAGLGLDANRVEVRLRAYTPGLRATLEARAGDRRLAVRAYAEDPAPEAALYRALAAGLERGGKGGGGGDSEVRVPPLLAWDRDLRLLVTDWLEGPTADERVTSGRGERAGELAARWFRRAAALPVTLGPSLGAACVLRQARSWIAELGAAAPALGAAATVVEGVLALTRPQEGAPRRRRPTLYARTAGILHRTRQRVAALRASDPALRMAAAALPARLAWTQPTESAPGLVHGALSVHHLIDTGDGGGPGVIDWERFGQGPAELDAGMFLATLWRIGLEDEALVREAARAEGAFVTGTAGLLHRRALSWYRAAALLRVAYQAASGREGDWLGRARALLDEAVRVAEAAG